MLILNPMDSDLLPQPSTSGRLWVVALKSELSWYHKSPLNYDQLEIQVDCKLLIPFQQSNTKKGVMGVVGNDHLHGVYYKLCSLQWNW